MSQRLSAHELRRRGTFKPARHARLLSPPARDRDYRAWLKGLTPHAQWFGRQMLAHTIPGDRQAWRRYLEALAAFNRLDRAGVTPEALGDANGRLTQLLTAVRSRWR